MLGPRGRRRRSAGEGGEVTMTRTPFGVGLVEICALIVAQADAPSTGPYGSTVTARVLAHDSFPRHAIEFTCGHVQSWRQTYLRLCTDDEREICVRCATGRIRTGMVRLADEINTVNALVESTESAPGFLAEKLGCDALRREAETDDYLRRSRASQAAAEEDDDCFLV